MPSLKKIRSAEVEEKNRRKKPARQEEGKVIEAPGGEMAPLSPMAGDPVALLTSPQMAHPANASLRAQATKELQRQRGNVYVQQLMKRIRAERGSGRPLEPQVRAEMESAFGQDFGDVRVHTDAIADRLARELRATAFTTGTDIFIRSSEPSPKSSEGKRLLGHELAHVAQQQGAMIRSYIGRAGDALEREAESAGWAVIKGASITSQTPSSTPLIQRQRRIEEEEAGMITAGEEEEIVMAYRVVVNGREYYLTQEQYEAEREEAIRTLRRAITTIRNHVLSSREAHQWFLKEVHNWVGVISDIFAGVRPPSVKIWDRPEMWLSRAERAIDDGRLDYAAKCVREAEREYNERHRVWYNYREATIGGAGRVVTTLEITRDVSFAVIGAVGGAFLTPAAASLIVSAGISAGVGAGLKLAEETLTQFSEWVHGLREGFDFGQMFRNMGEAAVTNFFGSLAGGALKNLFRAQVLDEIADDVIKEIAEETGLRITIATFKTVGQRAWGEFLASVGENLVKEAMTATLRDLETGEMITPVDFSRRIARQVTTGAPGTMLKNYLKEKLLFSL
jgi:hypothetical protein